MSVDGDDTASDGSYYLGRTAYRQIKAYRASLTPPKQSVNEVEELCVCVEFALPTYSLQQRSYRVAFSVCCIGVQTPVILLIQDQTNFLKFEAAWVSCVAG